MTRISGHTGQAHRAYQDALAKTPPPSERAPAAPTATARSRTFGFSLGKLGVEITTETLDLDRESVCQAARQSDPRAQAFGVECEVAALRSKLGRDYGPDRSPGGTAEPGAMRTRQALNAYSAAASLPETPVPVMFTATA